MICRTNISTLIRRGFSWIIKIDLFCGAQNENLCDFVEWILFSKMKIDSDSVHFRCDLRSFRMTNCLQSDFLMRSVRCFVSQSYPLNSRSVETIKICNCICKQRVKPEFEWHWKNSSPVLQLKILPWIQSRKTLNLFSWRISFELN